MKSIVAFAGVMILAASALAQPQAPSGLLCELLSHPEQAVITASSPHFGWIVNDPSRGAVQSAYQIAVASSEDKAREGADLWDSGKVASGESINVMYGGKELKSNTAYWWAVKTWDKSGAAGAWSKPQRFNTGDLAAKPAWPGESKWAKLPAPDNDGGKTLVLENRHPFGPRKISPLRVTEKSPGQYFVEFEKDYYGTLELKLNNPEDGKKVDISISEKSLPGDRVDENPGGSIAHFKTSITLARGQQTYVMQIPRRNPKSPHAQFMPSHMNEVLPFRYVELSGAPSALTKDNVTQLAVHPLFNDEASAFSSSSADLNAVWNMCKHTMKAAPFLGIYIDGERERMPYEADAYIEQLGHYCVDREYAIGRYSVEYLYHHPTWPTEWILQSLLMAWADYMYTGNLDLAARQYDVLKGKTLAALARADGLISTTDGKMSKAVLDSIRFTVPKYKDGILRDIVDWPMGERDGYVMKPYNTVVNAFHYQALRQMSQLAQAMGRKDDAENFRAKADKAFASFNKAFFDAKRGLYIDGEGTDHASLHANAFALALGLVPPERVKTVAEFIKSRKMACSVYAAQFLMDALYDAGESQAALDLLTATDMRSWMNMIRSGASMTMETWDIKFKPNTTWNHAWGAVPANTVGRKLCGVEPIEPGFARARIRPQVASLTQVSAVIPTIRGPVSMEIKKPAGAFSLDVTIPANMSAEVYLPAKSAAGVSESGKPISSAQGVKVLREQAGAVVLEIGGGKYSFTVKD